MSTITVNPVTGEVTDVPAVIPAEQIRNLPATQRETAITAYLANARDRLAEALQATGPQSVAQVRAEVATVAEMTKQLGLSRECRDDATEMVRRAEYGLNKSIRKGQDEGSIMTVQEAKSRAGKVRQLGVTYAELNPPKPTPSSFMERHEWNNSQGGISDLDASDEQFEESLSEARSEGNLSRANVVRKIKQKTTPQGRDQRAELIESMAREGYTSRQMAPRVGVSDESVRKIAREYGIDIPGDLVTGKRHRLNANRILSGAAESVSAAAYSLQQIDPLDLDQEAAQEWVDSLTESLSALRKALNPIKESLHG